ncbi:MAG: type II secretion system F family protein, partial [Flavobacteriales bacterium]
MSIDLTKYKTAAVSTVSVKKPEQKEKGLLDFLNRDISFFKRKLNDKQKENIYSELNTLLTSGVDIRSSLDLLEEEQQKKDVKRIITKLKSDVIKGMSLSGAMEASKQFTNYEFVSVRIGEESGRLPDILKELGHYFGKRQKMRRQLTGIFVYPVFLIVISVGILLFMLNNVVPMFADVFKKFGKELPDFTKQVIHLSEITRTWFPWFMLMLVVFILFLYIQRKKTWFRKISAQVLIRMPLFGPLIKKAYLARFCQSMHLLISSKTTLTESMALVEKMISFYPIEEALVNIRIQVTRGSSLHEAMANYKIFDKRMISLVRVSEEVNQLDHMFGKLANQYNDDVEHRTAIMGKLIEPVLILVIGLMVGTILVAMYQPMF